jgi:prevent-host-death family protein
MKVKRAKVVNVHEAKTHLSRLLRRVMSGEEVVIARAGTPIARLVPASAPPEPRELGFTHGTLNVPDDFNAPLPADLLDAFEGAGS